MTANNMNVIYVTSVLHVNVYHHHMIMSNISMYCVFPEIKAWVFVSFPASKNLALNTSKAFNQDQTFISNSFVLFPICILTHLCMFNNSKFVFLMKSIMIRRCGSEYHAVWMHLCVGSFEFTSCYFQVFSFSDINGYKVVS